MIPDSHYHAVGRWLADCRRPLLLTHRRADGDALGALAALSAALRNMGQDPCAALFDPLPPRYRLLEAAAAWRMWEPTIATESPACDAVIIVDTCALSQLEPVRAWLPDAPRTLVIDHHRTPDALGTRPGDLRLIDDTAAAASLLVAELLDVMGVTCTPEAATALLAGLATDTGWFRFSNTDARALRLAARLVEAGARPPAIYSAIYEQDAPGRLRLTGRMLAALELLADGRLAVLRLRQADFAAAGADRTMTEDLVNEAGRLAGVEALLLCTEEPDGTIRVNLRSKQTLDVAALAAQFGGGGHVRAAGARVTGTWDEVVPRVVAATLAALQG